MGRIRIKLSLQTVVTGLHVNWITKSAIEYESQSHDLLFRFYYSLNYNYQYLQENICSQCPKKSKKCSQWNQCLCFRECLKVLGSKFSKRCLKYFKLTFFFVNQIISSYEYGFQHLQVHGKSIFNSLLFLITITFSVNFTLTYCYLFLQNINSIFLYLGKEISIFIFTLYFKDYYIGASSISIIEIFLFYSKI